MLSPHRQPTRELKEKEGPIITQEEDLPPLPEFGRSCSEFEPDDKMLFNLPQEFENLNFQEASEDGDFEQTDFLKGIDLAGIQEKVDEPTLPALGFDYSDPPQSANIPNDFQCIDTFIRGVLTDPSISPPRFERSDLQMVKMPGTANNSYKETVWTEHLKSMMYEHQNLYENPLSTLLQNPNTQEQENPHLSKLISRLVDHHKPILGLNDLSPNCLQLPKQSISLKQKYTTEDKDNLLRARWNMLSNKTQPLYDICGFQGGPISMGGCSSTVATSEDHLSTSWEVKSSSSSNKFCQFQTGFLTASLEKDFKSPLQRSKSHFYNKPTQQFSSVFSKDVHECESLRSGMEYSVELETPQKSEINKEHPFLIEFYFAIVTSIESYCKSILVTLLSFWPRGLRDSVSHSNSLLIKEVQIFLRQYTQRWNSYSASTYNLDKATIWKREVFDKLEQELLEGYSIIIEQMQKAILSKQDYNLFDSETFSSHQWNSQKHSKPVQTFSKSQDISSLPTLDSYQKRKNLAQFMGTGGGVKDGGGGKLTTEDQAFNEQNWLSACEILAGSVGMEWQVNEYDIAGPPSLELFNESQKSMHQVINNPRLMPQTSQNPYSPRCNEIVESRLPLALLDIHHHQFSAHYVNYTKLDYYDSFYQKILAMLSHYQDEMFDKCKVIANEEKRKMLARCRVFYETTLPPFLRNFFEAKYIEFLATLTRHYIHDRVIPKVDTIKQLENPWISNSTRKINMESGFVKMLKTVGKLKQHPQFESLIYSIAVQDDSEIATLYSKAVTFYDEYKQCTEHNDKRLLKQNQKRKGIPLKFEGEEIERLYLFAPSSIHAITPRLLFTIAKMHNDEFVEQFGQEEELKQADEEQGTAFQLPSLEREGPDNEEEKSENDENFYLAGIDCQLQNEELKEENKDDEEENPFLKGIFSEQSFGMVEEEGARVQNKEWPLLMKLRSEDSIPEDWGPVQGVSLKAPSFQDEVFETQEQNQPRFEHDLSRASQKTGNFNENYE